MPFRKLGDEYSLSGKQVFLKVKAEIQSLPDNHLLTAELCDPARFCGFLVMDGKYIAVKGYDSKIPFIYGIDYLSHDIPYGNLFPAEDELAFYQFFQKLRELNYPLKVVIADDRKGLKSALLQHFPYARLQLCHTHYVENIRQLLNIRTDERHHHFFNSLHSHVFLAENLEQVREGLMHVMLNRTQDNRLLENIVRVASERKDDLFAYLGAPGCPNSTNLIELYNSHLQGRLKSIKGFESFASAKLWLNAYLIRRRTKTLTDCKIKFKHLNKHASLELSIKKQARWPDILTKLGIKKIKYFKNLTKKELKR